MVQRGSQHSEGGGPLSDDTLDIDELEEAEPEADEPDEEETAEAEPAGRKPGFLSRIGQRIKAPIAERAQRARWDALNWRVGVIGAVVILLVWLLLANLSPVRIVVWLWVIDIPKALAFAIDFALGALLMWLWMWRRSRTAPAEGEGDESQ
jgi:uncharacterized integral membrane protein